MKSIWLLLFAVLLTTGCQHESGTGSADASCGIPLSVQAGEIAHYRFVLQGAPERVLQLTVHTDAASYWGITVTEAEVDTDVIVSKICGDGTSTKINDSAINLILYGGSWGIGSNSSGTDNSDVDGTPPEEATNLGCELGTTGVEAGDFYTNNCSFKIETGTSAGLATVTAHSIVRSSDLAAQPFHGLIYQLTVYENSPDSSVELMSWNLL